MAKRIGIFSGTFDPVHEGHIGLALAAIEAASLDKVYFLPEVQPRRKEGVTHFAHRIAMLRLATADHPKLNVLELPDRQFSVAKTLPRLQQKFKGNELFFVAGSDMLAHMPSWPLITPMMRHMGLIVGLRGGTSRADMQRMISSLPHKPSAIFIIKSPKPNLSSAQLRQALIADELARILPDIKPYVKEHWLYSGIVPNGS